MKGVLGTTELVVGRFGLGTATFGREAGSEAAFAILDHARTRGVNFFVLAEAYSQGAAEEIVGAWLKDRGRNPEDVIASKFSAGKNAAAITAACEASLKRLGLDCLDLYQLHAWDAVTPLAEILGALDTLRRQGKIRHGGISNLSASQLRDVRARESAMGLRVVGALELQYSLAARGIEEALVPLAREEGLGIVTYGPLASGFLTGKYRRGEKLPEGSRFDIAPGHQNIYFQESCWAALDRLQAVAAQSGLSPARIAIAWASSRPESDCILIGGRNVAQIEQWFSAEEVDPAWLSAL